MTCASGVNHAAPEVVEEAPKEEPPAAEPAPVVEEASGSSCSGCRRSTHSTSSPEPVKAKAVSAAPNVRRLAQELGIDIKSVSASAESGRISLDDVKSHARSLLSGGGAP